MIEVTDPETMNESEFSMVTHRGTRFRVNEIREPDREGDVSVDFQYLSGPKPNWIEISSRRWFWNREEPGRVKKDLRNWLNEDLAILRCCTVVQPSAPVFTATKSPFKSKSEPSTSVVIIRHIEPVRRCVPPRITIIQPEPPESSSTTSTDNNLDDDEDEYFIPA